MNDFEKITNTANASTQVRKWTESAMIDSSRREDDIVGRSPAFASVLNQIGIIAKSDSVTLIQGETGTGKEVIARAIHNQSLRNRGPFVKLNCAAIPGTLLESELFGHERGAFTGAIAQTIGRFQQADNGTLFLDEIGDLPLELQPKLLRALQEQEFERLGSGRKIHGRGRRACRPDDPGSRRRRNRAAGGQRQDGSRRAALSQPQGR